MSYLPTTLTRVDNSYCEPNSGMALWRSAIDLAVYANKQMHTE